MSVQKVSRILGVNAAIVLQYGGANQSTIRGLNKLTLPALTRSKIKSEEFGIDFAVNDAGGGEHGDIAYGGNMVIGDTKGQDQLKAYLIGNIKFTDARVYISTVTGDFLAADIASDPEAGFQVIDNKPGQVNKNGTYPFDGTWCVSGLYAIFTIHRPDVKTTPQLAFVASVSPTTVGGTITDSTDGFITAGFLEGMTLIIEGSTSNNGTYLIQSVAAGVITLQPAGTNGGQLTTEASPGAACILHGGSL